MLRKILFLTLAFALVFATAAPVVLSTNHAEADGDTALVASVFMADPHFLKADPECPPPVNPGGC